MKKTLVSRILQPLFRPLLQFIGLRAHLPKEKLISITNSVFDELKQKSLEHRISTSQLILLEILKGRIVEQIEQGKIQRVNQIMQQLDTLN